MTAKWDWKVKEWCSVYWTQQLCEFINVNKCAFGLFPAYTQIQPNSLVQQHKQQQQFVALQSQSSQRTPGQSLQTASIQPSQHPVPVLPKPAAHQPSTPSQQATIFHSTISPHALHSNLNHTKAHPVQLTAINLQIQPTVSTPLPNQALVATRDCSRQFGLGLMQNRYLWEVQRCVKIMSQANQWSKIHNCMRTFYFSSTVGLFPFFLRINSDKLKMPKFL